MEAMELAQKVVDSYNGLVYLKNIKAYMQWNDELNTWVVVQNDSITESINHFADEVWDAALVDKRPDVVRSAMKLQEQATRQRISRAIAAATTNNITILQGNLADRHVGELEVVPVKKRQKEQEAQTEHETDEYQTYDN